MYRLTDWFFCCCCYYLFAIYLYHDWLNVNAKTNTKTFIAELYFPREKTLACNKDRVNKTSSIKFLNYGSKYSKF